MYNYHVNYKLDKTVLVVSGGASLESSVSWQSGQRVYKALQRLGYKAELIEPSPAFVSQVIEMDPAFVFIAMHGRGGEDGTIQEILEIMGVPFVGSDSLVSAICLDKARFKQKLREAKIGTPDWQTLSRQSFTELGAGDLLENLIQKLGLPLVSKPNTEGSSFGIRIIEDGAEAEEAKSLVVQSLLGTFSYCDQVILEKWVDGREFAVTVVGETAKPQSLSIIEIITEEKFYTFEAHYDSGAVNLAKANITESERLMIENAACAAYQIAGCRDFARVDLFLDQKGQVQILEINTIPGLTITGPTSWAADASGMEFDDFIKLVISRVASKD